MAGKRKWVRNVKTVSTFPPKNLFKKDARTIARIMKKKTVSPKGAGSGIRMIQYFINRGGKNLSMTRRRELEKAKAILQKKLKAQRRTQAEHSASARRTARTKGRAGRSEAARKAARTRTRRG